MVTTKPIVGTICLYGTRATGPGYIAACDQACGQAWRAGTGDPLPGLTFTQALWLGLDELAEHRGSRKGGCVTVHIDRADLALVAVVDLAKPFPYFGALCFTGGGEK